MVRKLSFNKRNKIILACLGLVGVIIGSIFFTIIIILPIAITPSLLYFPLGIGTSWTYNSTDDNGTWTTLRNIGDNGEFLGIDYTVHFNEIHDGEWQNRMWIGVTCNSLVWWGFQDTSSKYIASFGLTYVVEPVGGLQANGGTTSGFLTIGSQISIENFQGSYTIEAIEDVVVPNGTFQNCIKMHEVEYTPGGKADFHVWYAPNIGPVKYDYPNRANRSDVLESYIITADDPFETWLLPKVPRMIITTIVVVSIIGITIVVLRRRKKHKKSDSKE